MPALDPKIILRFMVFKVASGSRGYSVVDRTTNSVAWGPGSKQDAMQESVKMNEEVKVTAQK